jgi:hypothetical protein
MDPTPELFVGLVAVILTMALLFMRSMCVTDLKMKVKIFVFQHQGKFSARPLLY